MKKIFYLLSLFFTFFIISSCSIENTPIYQLSTTAEPEAAGSVTPPSGEYDEGEQVQITATANENWVFDRWSGGYTGNTSPANITMDSDKNITAIFIERGYPLTILTEGDGSVIERVVQEKTTDYPDGTTVELTADPSNGWAFAHWDGDLTGNENPAQIEINEEKEVTAFFERGFFELVLHEEGEGSISAELVSGKQADDGAYEYESTVELTANAEDGWKFSYWQGDAEGSENPITIEIDSENNFTAVFEQKETVSGFVTQESGIPVEGVEISFTDRVDPVYTDQNGFWILEEPPFPLSVTAASDAWDFPIQTRLVLEQSENINFTAYADYTAPRGSRIAYQYREDCSGGLSCDKPYSIWTMAPNGLHKEKLTDEMGSDRNPTWSPDGSKFAFDSNRGEEENENYIWIMDEVGSNKSNTGVRGMEPDWSPDGDRIVYLHEGNIYIMELDGNHYEIFNSGSDTFASSPTWSPDGTKVAFHMNKDETHIWVMEDDGRNLTQLTSENSPNRDPAWEPSGKGILYSSRPAAVDRLRIMDVDGSNDRREEYWPDHDQKQPAWSPRGGEIIYVHRRMIPISEFIHWIPAIPSSVYEWSRIAPDSGDPQFWARSPAWSPK